MDNSGENEKKFEPDLEQDSVINNRYIIKRKIGEGAFSKVYVVLDKDDNEEYASKILLEKRAQIETKTFNNEIKILKKLSENSIINNYVSKFHDSGIGDITNEKNELIGKERHYLVSTYYPKKNLFKYLDKTEEGLEEKQAKIIFAKILKGIQFVHNSGICHLDIKSENIVFDEHYNSAIIDFGFSYEMEKDDNNEFKPIKDKEIKGTPYYICPQMWTYRDYNGIKADIFSLGVVLFYLVTKKFSFDIASRRDNSYRLICLNKPSTIEEFWKKKSDINPKILRLSPEFKKLFFKLIVYNEKGRPNSIQEILDDPWMNDINNFTNNDYLEYENMMKNLEDKVNQDDETIENVQIKANNKDESGFKSSNHEDDEKEIYFDSNIGVNYLYKSGFNAMNYIKIKAELEPVIFMNSLANRLKQVYQYKINPYLKNLKFEATFPNKLKEILDNMDEIEDEEEIEDDNIEQFEFKDCVIKIELFEHINGGYEIHFTKGEGEFMDYYSYFKDIKLIIKKILHSN